MHGSQLRSQSTLLGPEQSVRPKFETEGISSLGCKKGLASDPLNVMFKVGSSEMGRGVAFGEPVQHWDEKACASIQSTRIDRCPQSYANGFNTLDRPAVHLNLMRQADVGLVTFESTRKVQGTRHYWSSLCRRTALPWHDDSFLVKLLHVFVLTILLAENTPFAVIVYEVSGVTSEADVCDSKFWMGSLLDRKFHEDDKPWTF